MTEEKNSINAPTQTLEEIWQECHKKTAIIYNDKGFFTPKLRSINHLSVGRSRMISNPLTVFLELLYLLFRKTQNLWKICIRKISPKPMDAPVEAGPLDSALVGKITFAGRVEKNAPLHNMKVVFWERTWLLQWRKLSEGVTDRNGQFKLPFNLQATKRWAIFRRYFQIYQTRYSYIDGSVRKYQYKLVHTIKVPGGDLVGMEYNLRTIPLFYWEYRTDSSVPRTAIKDHDKDAPQYYSQGRTDALNEQLIPIELTKLRHLKKLAKNPNSLSLEQIQHDYPTNLTAAMEKKQQGITRGDEWFGLRMMNGMYAATFVPDEADTDYYWTRLYGACCYQCPDKEYAFPTAEIKSRLNDRGIMMPQEIHLTGPLTAHEKDPWQQQVFTPDDGDQWLQAKRVARVTGALATELDDHFAGTHLTTEQFAIAAFRNLRLNPIAALLFPHLKEVALVNHTADSILVGPAQGPKLQSSIRAGGIIPWLRDLLDSTFNTLVFEEGGYIPQASAMTNLGINERVRDMLGVQNWHDWQPMEAVSEAHYFAKSQKVFWDMLTQYVDSYIDENIEEIGKYWFEIYCFSKDLVEHAVPLYLSDLDFSTLGENEKRLARKRLEWYRRRYRINLSSPREIINGEEKVLSPITLSADFLPDDIDNLKQACRYIIMMATFMHSFVNEHQYDDIGEVLYNCLGLRFGDGKDGIIAPETDTRIAPDLVRSTQMMWFSNLLSRTEYGFIVRNEEKDINPELLRLLHGVKKDIEQDGKGMLIENIESRTNI